MVILSGLLPYVPIGIFTIGIFTLTYTMRRNRKLDKAAKEARQAKQNEVPVAPVVVTLPAAESNQDTAQADNHHLTLPIQLPDHGPLPTPSRMDYARNRLFVGRQEDIVRIRKALKPDKTVAIGQIAAATGLGGIGKTQLAIEFVHLYGQFFKGGVFWLGFENPDQAPAEIAACGAVMGLHPAYDQLPQETQVQLVEQEWRKPLPRLLVFDNCEDETLLERYGPATGGCRILVTSRRQRFSKNLGVSLLHLGVLSTEKCVELLCKLCPGLDPSRPVLAEIAEELGGLPLAVHLAGSYLDTVRDTVTPEVFLDNLRGQDLLDHPAMKGVGTEGQTNQHDMHVARTFAISLDQLAKDSPRDQAARDLLVRASYFAAGEPIPRGLLLETLALEEPHDAVLKGKALGRLVDLGLLETDTEDTVTMHRLLETFVRKMESGTAQEDVGDAVYRQAAALNRQGLPKRFTPLRVHLRNLVRQFKGRHTALEASLLGEWGYYLKMIGDFKEAEAMYRRALVIDEAALGGDHPSVATRLNNLASLLEATNRMKEAEPMYRRALVIDEAALGGDHPKLAIRLNNLALLFKTTNRMKEAEPMYRRALVIDEAALGGDHPIVAIRLNNLAGLLKATNRMKEAEPMYRRALAIDEAALGGDHPNVAIDLNNLAGLLDATNRMKEAEPMYRRALEIDEAALGGDHPKVARRLNNLAGLLEATNRMKEAEPMYRRAVQIMEDSLGPDHPNAQTTRANWERLKRELSGSGG